MKQRAIGIDVGGTGIKGAAIDPETGEKLSSRHKVLTPPGGHPDLIAREVGAMADAIRSELGVKRSQRDEVPVGVTLPGVVRDGIMRTAANVDREWIGLDARELLSEEARVPCLVVNDADAAGVAETAFGAARGAEGATVVLTFGTGIGVALVFNGVLIPNLELGHLELDGKPDIERFVSPKCIEREGLSLAEWGERAAAYVRHIELLLNPDRFVIGGSISKDADRYLPFAGVLAPVVPAEFRNNAGIVGAAWLAAEGDRAVSGRHAA